MRYLLVKTKSAAKVSKARARKKFDALNCREVKEIPRIRWKRVEVQDEDFDRALFALQNDPDIEGVQEEGVSYAYAAPPNDTLYKHQWVHRAIGTEAIRHITKGNVNTKIAVIDSGVLATHEDLAGKVLAGFNCVTETTDTTPVNFHGTGVATCAAAADNGVGTVGVAPNCKIIPVLIMKSVNGVLSATTADVAQGIRWAADAGADIINCSFGTPNVYTAEQDAINYAVGKGCIVVAAAGNTGTLVNNYPGAYPNVINVGASDEFDKPAYFTTRNTTIDLSAPGSNVIMGVSSGGYGTFNGTSFASPYTAGVVALLKDLKPDLTFSEALQKLADSADQWKDVAYQTAGVHGAGILNAWKAVTNHAITLPQYSGVVFAWVRINEFLLKGTYAKIYQPTTFDLFANCSIGITNTKLYIDDILVYEGLPQTYTFYPEAWEEGTHRVHFEAFSGAAVGVWDTIFSVYRLSVIGKSASTPSISSFNVGPVTDGVVAIDDFTVAAPTFNDPVLDIVYSDQSFVKMDVFVDGVLRATNDGGGNFSIDVSSYITDRLPHTFRFDITHRLLGFYPSLESAQAGGSPFTYSEERVLAFALPLPPPYATPSGGRYLTTQTVTLTDPAGGSILYTLDGSDPRHYIPVFEGKATFDNGVLVLLDEPIPPDI